VQQARGNGMMIQSKFGEHSRHLYTVDHVRLARSPGLAIVRHDSLFVGRLDQLQFTTTERLSRPLDQSPIRFSQR
jgi:hypothetical protein